MRKTRERKGKVAYKEMEDEKDEDESKSAKKNHKGNSSKRKRRDEEEDDEEDEYIPISESEDDELCIVEEESKGFKGKMKNDKRIELVPDSEEEYFELLSEPEDNDKKRLTNTKRKREVSSKKKKHSKPSDDDEDKPIKYKTPQSKIVYKPIDLESFSFNNNNDELPIKTTSYSAKPETKGVSNRLSLENSSEKVKRIYIKPQSNKKDEASKDEEDDKMLIDSDKNNLEDNAKPKGLKDSEADELLFSEKTLPSFMLPENVKDKLGRTPLELNYNPATLYIPKKYYDEQTPAMKQYWNIKQDNYDKIVLFKIGRFYEMFFDDAIIGNKLLELNWMGSDPKKMHVAFPERSLDNKLAVFIEAGYTVALVEQLETEEMKKERLKESDKKDCPSTKREVTNVITRGTYCKFDSNYKNQYCLTLVYYTINKSDANSVPSQSNNSEWGVMIFDVTTLNFYLGTVKEDPKSAHDDFSKLRALLYTISPEEVIIQRNNIPQAAINFIHSLSSKPHIRIVKNDYSLKKLNDIAIKYFGEDFNLWNQVLLTTITNEDKHLPQCISLYVTIGYLENILLSKECLLTASFYQYNDNSIINPKKSLILDYQATLNLEVAETKVNPKNMEEGSLLEYLNQAKTPFGKRLLKNWILNPLYDIGCIEERLDMVDDLIANEELLDSLRKALGKMPDLERQCAKFYKFASDSKENIVHIEDIGKNRLHEFFSLLETLSKTIHLFESLSDYLDSDSIKSPLLKKKLTVGENEGEVPNIKEALSDLSNNFHIVESKDYKDNPVTIIESKEGICPSFDLSKKKLEEAFAVFDDILVKERKKLKCAIINYTHTKGFKFELEIPEEYVKKKPDGYILTTKRKGFVRFHTKEIQEYVKELAFVYKMHKIEKNKLNAVLFQLFLSKKALINYYLNNLAELDSISALAYVSVFGQDINKTSCRPKLIPIEQRDNKPYLELINCTHPCLSSKISHFVPNDIIIGKDDKTLIVITGPNMGGKSTLLRSTCIAIIMAQIGCYVPASKCILTPVDRIFTRIGARDVLLEGKSTFYIEMEETKSILQHATVNSMVIMDELGRGTSTHDGKLIAKAIITRIEKGIGCRTLFTTHYHDIIDWCQAQIGIDLFFMDCNIDMKTKDIAFKYKFTRGVCPESYGISIAKLAGIPQSIIDMATDVSKLHKNQSKCK